LMAEEDNMRKVLGGVPLRVALPLLAIVLGVVLGLAGSSGSRAQGPQTACRVNACAANCVSYQYVLNARNLSGFVRWYDSAYTLTGCDDPDWWQNFQFLLAIAAEIVGAPSGYILDCRQMVLGQYSVCLDQCESNNCRYAPNVRARMNSCSQGAVSVTVDNERASGLPEYDPTAYSRAFPLSLWLNRDGGRQLLLYRADETTLAYPNWVISGGYDSCRQQYTDARCDLLEMFIQPSETGIDLDWGDGLYNMTSLIASSSGASNTASQGYVDLNSDGNSVTMSQGDVSGFTVVHVRTKSGFGSWSSWSTSVSSWNAYGGNHTVTNSESNSWYDWNKTDRDTTVFVTRGPGAALLTGEYTLEASAPLAHDKDTSDNVATCTLDITVPPPPQQGATATPMAAQCYNILPGATSSIMPPGSQGNTYCLQVPPGLTALRVMLRDIPSGSDFDLYTQHNCPPQQCGADCASLRGSNLDEECYLTLPAAGMHYLWARPYTGSGYYEMWVEFIRGTPTPTITPTPRATYTPTPTPIPWTGESESEPNDSLATADSWAVGGTMRGRLDRANDWDFYRFVASESGIYTILLDQVPAEIAPDLVIYGPNRNMVASDFSVPAGAAVSLTVDANEGEAFWVRVKASSASQVSSAYYRLGMHVIADPHEPDDAFATATTWDWQAGPIYGYFWERVSGEADFYTVTVPSSVLLTVHLDGVADTVRPDLTIYQQNRVVAATELSTPIGQPVSLTIDANAGETFAIRVRPSSRAEVSDQPYRLRVTTVPDPHEPDDTFPAATAWDWQAAPIQGYFWERVSGEADFYTVTVPASVGSVLLTLHLENVPTDVQPDLTLYGPNRVVVASEYSTAAGQPIALTIDANEGESFTVRVRPSSRNQTSDQPYTLRASTIPDYYEPNDSYSTAFDWDWQAGPMQGYFWERASGEEDFYVIKAPPGPGMVQLTVSLTNVPANVQPDLLISSEQRTLLAANYSAAAGQSVTLTAVTPGGSKVYVRVRPSYRSQTSAQPYTLSVSAEQLGATPTRTATASRTPTLIHTPTATRTPTLTRTPTPSRTPTLIHTPTASRTPTATRTPTLTRTPTATRTVTASRTATLTPTATRTRTPTPTPGSSQK
jgi:hypothetical protein